MASESSTAGVPVMRTVGSLLSQKGVKTIPPRTTTHMVSIKLKSIYNRPLHSYRGLLGTLLNSGIDFRHKLNSGDRNWDPSVLRLERARVTVIIGSMFYEIKRSSPLYLRSIKVCQRKS